MTPLETIGPIDGRYRKLTEALAPIFSESALIRYRVMVEAEYLIMLGDHPDIGLKPLTAEEKQIVRNLYLNFSLEDAELTKTIETKGYGKILATNQDIKAM